MHLKKDKNFLLGFWTLLLLTLANFACNSRQLPIYGELPDFQLLDQEGRAFSRKDLNHKVWAANFIFTSCGGRCPLLTQKMTQVQTAILAQAEEDPHTSLRIVSFSVDPERDTPERLKAYAEKYKVNSAYWSFLTGPYEQIQRTIVDGFKISMVKMAKSEAAEPSDFDVVHGEKFILVDAQGQIRGYYDADHDGIRQLIGDMKSLAKP